MRGLTVGGTIGAGRTGAMSHAETRAQAMAAFWRFAQPYRGRYPKAVACLERDLDDLLSYLSSPPAHRSRPRTTTIIERAFREVRRWTRPIGVLTHSRSLGRIVYAVIHHLNESWREAPLREFAHNS